MTSPGPSASVTIINTAARPGISIGRRGWMSFHASAMNAGATIAVTIHVVIERSQRIARIDRSPRMPFLAQTKSPEIFRSSTG